MCEGIPCERWRVGIIQRNLSAPPPPPKKPILVWIRPELVSEALGGFCRAEGGRGGGGGLGSGRQMQKRDGRFCLFLSFFHLRAAFFFRCGASFSCELREKKNGERMNKIHPPRIPLPLPHALIPPPGPIEFLTRTERERGRRFFFVLIYISGRFRNMDRKEKGRRRE